MLIIAADMPSLTMLAVYSHAFGSGNICDNFCGLGGKYALKRYALTCNQIFG